MIAKGQVEGPSASFYGMFGRLTDALLAYFQLSNAPSN